MKIKNGFIILGLLLVTQMVLAQQALITKSSVTTFFSHSPMEDIEAVNKQTTAAIDFAKSEIVVKMLIKHFAFENALMQEHFNENYMESEKYPAAIFKGKFTHQKTIDPKQDGKYTVDVIGELTIHGVTKPLTTTATISIDKGVVAASTKFIVKPKDHKIEIPSLVVKNIAEEIEVTSNLNFDVSK